MGWYDEGNIWYSGSVTTTGSDGSVSITRVKIGDKPAVDTGGYTFFPHGWITATGCSVWIQPRTIYVEMPEHYAPETCEAFASLVNSNDFGGWKVKAIIHGKVCITDPNDEVRSFADFLPLLRSKASGPAREALDVFLAKHPVEKPKDETSPAADEDTPPV